VLQRRHRGTLFQGASVLLLILKIARMYSADYGGWARPSTADLSIILGPVVPFRRTRRALFDGVPCTAREIYEGKHSRQRRSGLPWQ